MKDEERVAQPLSRKGPVRFSQFLDQERLPIYVCVPFVWINLNNPIILNRFRVIVPGTSEEMKRQCLVIPVPGDSNLCRGGIMMYITMLFSRCRIEKSIATSAVHVYLSFFLSSFLRLVHSR